MSHGRLYLDHNATTPLRPEARAAMLDALSLVGSASSVHGEGRAARRLVEDARAEVAALVGVPASGVVFTSGASEANATALSPHWRRDGRAAARPDRCLVGAGEHASVRAGGRFGPDAVETLPLDTEGRLDIGQARRRIAEMAEAGHAPMVSVMAANNETGVLQPVAELAQAVTAAGGVLHSDVAQIAGKLPFDAAGLGADLLTLSSHKLGGPLGIGALVVAAPDLHLDAPLIGGGGQERGVRAGTENLPAIAGFAAAARAVRETVAAQASRQRRLVASLEEGLRAQHRGIVVFGAGAARLPNTSCFAVPDLTAEMLLIALDLDGIAVSSGAACSSGKVRRSHVLGAMGVPPALADGAIRVSLGTGTTEADIDRFLATFNAVCGAIHERRRRRAA